MNTLMPSAHSANFSTVGMAGIVIIDFGSQYTQLIARRIRELAVFAEIIQPEAATAEYLDRSEARGIILSGGPHSAEEEQAPRIPPAVLKAGLPILGICYGMQVLALQFGGRVKRSTIAEFGHAEINLSSPQHCLFPVTATANPLKRSVWMSHGDQVSQLPPGFTIIASTDESPIAAFAHDEKQLYGLQFHPEVTHTLDGEKILAQFALAICACSPTWTPAAIAQTQIDYWRQTIAQDHVILGLSGGVDSAVVALLLHRAIGTQLTAIFIDNGLLRWQEKEEVLNTFQQKLGITVKFIDASAEFLNALADISDPEQKRKIIGKQFVDVFQKTAQELKNVKWLAQGTIYPDVIESAKSHSQNTHVIKSHHNVGGLPDSLHLKLVEPLRELFKDEVRKIGALLGLPAEILQRHPFPGPGLAVRMMGAVRSEWIPLLQKADAIFLATLKKCGYFEQTAQAFAVLLPINSVAVVGDQRRDGMVIALRAVSTSDFMTATVSEIPLNVLQLAANRIVNELPAISRVVFDITSKPPATIEWE